MTIHPAVRPPEPFPHAAGMKSDGRLGVYSAVLSAVVVGALGLWGGWARRWMSDDGLIVLRTVRNLIAGNGPVFNAGERVEANTSTLWQYLIFAGERLTGARLEYVAFAQALVLSIVALVVGVWATSRMNRGSVVLPAGALVYIALPPARDFFTSGLEWGLSIFYLAVLWWLLVRWALSGQQELRHTAGRGQGAVLVLAFWAGLSWLVRPELALYGGVTGLVLLASTVKAARVQESGRWRYGLSRCALIVAAALPIPAAYQVFRMGYYGLITPHTAVAKSATGAAWASGFNYARDFFGPYFLWLPLLVLSAFAALCLRAVVRGRLAVAVGVMVGCALLHAVYVLRVGGDFMHGRMWLLPLFALLLPVFVVPLRRAGTAPAAMAAPVAAVIVLGVWALCIVLRGHPVDWNMFKASSISVVDEREFWTYATTHEPGRGPMVAEEFLGAKQFVEFNHGLADIERGAAMSIIWDKSLLSGDETQKDTYVWQGIPRQPGRQDPPTLYWINMGMSSMNSPLSVRVLDPIGLATPLAARQPRIEGGRIGHDKNLSWEWQLADSGANLAESPPWVDVALAQQAREALQAPQFQELFATYRAPLTPQRFWDNIKWSLGKGRTLQLSDAPQDYLHK